MIEPSPEEVDRFLAQLGRASLPALTDEEISSILGRIRQGAVVRTCGYEDYLLLSFGDGRYVQDEFNHGIRRTTYPSEREMRAMAASMNEFRMLLDSPTGAP